MNMYERLRSLSSPIQIGIIGVGSIGKGLVYQASITPGIRCVAIADTVIERAINVAKWLQLDFSVVENVGELDCALRQGKLAVAGDGLLVAAAEPLDLVIEATNTVYAAGLHAMAAIEHGTHVAMMNYEADVAFGPYLLTLAQQHGVVYTGADGDQPAGIKTLIDEIRLWGFDLVMAGNIKGYLDRYADPTSILAEAEKRNLDPKMCASYTDGSKLNIEMASLANAVDLQTARVGMMGPRLAHLSDIFDHFDLESLWAERGPVIDYVLGAEPRGGVFVVGHTEDLFQRFTLEWYPSDLGPGPFYVFHRPYHLGHIEAMLGVAEAVLDGRPRLQPQYGFKTNVYAYAKRDLQSNEMLDGIGGYTCYGLVENCVDNLAQPGLPIVFSENARLKRAIPKDAKIQLDDIEFSWQEPPFDLYAKALAATPGSTT